MRPGPAHSLDCDASLAYHRLKSVRISAGEGAFTSSGPSESPAYCRATRSSACANAPGNLGHLLDRLQPLANREREPSAQLCTPAALPARQAPVDIVIRAQCLSPAPGCSHREKPATDMACATDHNQSAYGRRKMQAQSASQTASRAFSHVNDIDARRRRESAPHQLSPNIGK